MSATSQVEQEQQTPQAPAVSPLADVNVTALKKAHKDAEERLKPPTLSEEERIAGREKMEKEAEKRKFDHWRTADERAAARDLLKNRDALMREELAKESGSASTAPAEVQQAETELPTDDDEDEDDDDDDDDDGNGNTPTDTQTGTQPDTQPETAAEMPTEGQSEGSTPATASSTAKPSNANTDVPGGHDDESEEKTEDDTSDESEGQAEARAEELESWRQKKAAWQAERLRLDNERQREIEKEEAEAHERALEKERERRELGVNFGTDDTEGTSGHKAPEGGLLPVTLKAEGNRLYTVLQFEAAVESYTKAIELGEAGRTSPEQQKFLVQCRSNRAAAYLRLCCFRTGFAHIPLAIPRLRSARTDCAKALALLTTLTQTFNQPDEEEQLDRVNLHLKLLKRRATACTWLGEHRQALADRSRIGIVRQAQGMGPEAVNEEDIDAADRAMRLHAALEANKDEQQKQEGDEAFHEQNYHAALDCYSAAIAVQPLHVGYLANRAATFFAVGDFQACVADCYCGLAALADRGESTFKEHAARWPRKPSAKDPRRRLRLHALRSAAFAAMGRMALARQDILEALELAPDELSESLQKDLQAIDHRIRRNGYIRQGQEVFRRQEFKKAKELFGEGLEWLDMLEGVLNQECDVHGKCALLSNRAACSLSLEDAGSALTDTGAALHILRSYIQTGGHYDKGILKSTLVRHATALAWQGQMEEAKIAYEEALELCKARPSIVEMGDEGDEEDACERADDDDENEEERLEREGLERDLARVNKALNGDGLPPE